MDKKKQLSIILVNLGTPDSPTAPSIRKYLKEFLSDPRVVNLPRLIWLPILYGFILTLRPAKLVQKYQMIWGEKDAPIREITASLAESVRQHLGNQHTRKEVLIKYAMTYGNPSLESVINEVEAEGANDILFIPLFPQYCSATTAAVIDKISTIFKRRTFIPSYRIINHYYSHDKYTHALTKSLEKTIRKIEDGAKLIFSFHGIPMSLVEAGDPYPSQCQKTAEQVAYSLALDEKQWLLTFQSRFGSSPWVQPYTDVVLADLPGQGVKKVLVICPGFATDCLETLEEIEDRAQATFIAAGGEEFHYVPALNDGPDHVALISELILTHLYPCEIDN